MAVIALILYGLALIVSLVSWIWFIVLASKEGIAWVIAVIIPCTSLIASIVLTVKDFEKAKIPFGLLVLSIVLSAPFTYVSATGAGISDLIRPDEVTTFKTFRDPVDDQYTVSVPTSWTSSQDTQPLTLRNEARKTALQIYVVDPDGVEADDIGESLANAVSKAGVNATISDVLVGGMPAKRVTYEKDGARNIEVLVDGGDTWFALRTFGVDLFKDEDGPLFDKIIASFALTSGVSDTSDSGGGGIDLDTPEKPTTPKKPVDTKPKNVPTEASLVAKVKTAKGDERLWALQQWRTHRLDRTAGARARMLEAWGETYPPDAQRMILASLKDLPLDTGEALQCLKLPLPGVMRERIITKLREDGKADADAFAAALANVPETKTFLIEETLIEIGRPREGAVGRLIEGRGDAWALSPEGRELIGKIAEIGELEVLVASENAEVRAMACDLLAGADGSKEALQHLKGLLKDETAEVRRRSAAAMQEIGDPKASMYLAVALVKEKDDQVKGALNTAMNRLPLAETIQYLTKLYKSKKPGLRMAGVVGARAIKSAQVVPLLSQVLREEEKKPILMAALEGLRSMASHSDLRKKMSIAARDLEAVARTSKDKDVQRLAGRVYYSVTGQVVKR